MAEAIPLNSAILIRAWLLPVAARQCRIVLHKCDIRTGYSMPFVSHPDPRELEDFRVNGEGKLTQNPGRFGFPERKG